MFTKCCSCNKKYSKNKRKENDNLKGKMSNNSLQNDKQKSDLSQANVESEDNGYSSRTTPVLLSFDEPLSNVSEVTAQNNCVINVEEAPNKEPDVNELLCENSEPECEHERSASVVNPTTPYPVKKSSISIIPRWLSEEDDQEIGGTQEPPATPVGKDELALKRHRFFSELMTASQAVVEHRVSFDPLGPVVASDEPASNYNINLSELEYLVIRLERVTSRLEELTRANIKLESTNGNEDDMSVNGFNDIIRGPFAQYLNISQQIGDDVSNHSLLVEKAFEAQLQYLTLANQSKAPSSQSEQFALLQPTSEHIAAVQNFREKNRGSQYFNHLSAISESIPALGWVTVSPAPAPYVKEMNDAGQFYTNRVLKDWKEKDKKHIEWVKSWIQTLNELQQFIKQHHTTGLVWAGKDVPSAPPPPPSGCPPPPPIMNLADITLDDPSQDRSALFAQINQGEAITKNLKKVTSDMQTHKNPTLRTGPAPFKAPTSSTQIKTMAPSLPVDKPPSFTRDGKKWLIEYQKGNQNLIVENVEMNNVVYMFKCVDSVLTVKGKLNSIIMDSCKKSSVVFDSLVSSVEFINCQSVQMQVLGKVPTISIDKTDGCQIYLSKESLDVEIITSKSSEMNVLVPKSDGDYTEHPIPEQFKTIVDPVKGLSTIIVESKG